MYSGALCKLALIRFKLLMIFYLCEKNVCLKVQVLFGYIHYKR